MKLLSLFDGSGAFPLAAERHGITARYASEVEPFPIAVTRARFPDMEHLGDITKIDGGKIEPCEIVSFGSPCFPAGTHILTTRGYVPIEDIPIGEMVLTHLGRWRKVTATSSKIAPTVVLKGNHFGLETTHEHPIYSTEIKNYYPSVGGKRRIVKTLANVGEWTCAAKMGGKQWATPNTTEPLPIPPPQYHSAKQKELPELNEEFFYFVGRWLGDGWVRTEQRAGRPNGQQNGQIFLCDSFDKEQELIDTVSPISENYSVFRERTAVKIRFCSTALCDWLTANFGKGAADKTIPAWVFSLPVEYREAVLRGVEESDGHKIGENQIKISTVSKKLMLGLRLLGETLGYSTSTYFYKRKPSCAIEGRTVNQKNTYTITFTKSKRNTNMRHGVHTWYKCREVIDTGTTKEVYNLSVEDDESYVADGIVVHNCTDISIAGKGEGISAARSGLFFEAIRVIREMLDATGGEYPRYFLLDYSDIGIIEITPLFQKFRYYSE
jgi:hypothetical protein